MSVKDSSVKDRVQALKQDLLTPGGPQINTMSNFGFAILHYAPEDEFVMRSEIGKMVLQLRHLGWRVQEIDLLALLLARLKREEGEDILQEMIDLEKRKYQRMGLKASLAYLDENLAGDLERPDGLAADIIAEIQAQEAGESPHLVLLSRAGALYPFFKTSGLLCYLDGHTGRALVVFLYPGSRPNQDSLSFMGEANADSDYRPRIY